MVINIDTLDVCHELTEVGQKHYMELLVRIALAKVSGRQYFSDEYEFNNYKKSKARKINSPIRPITRVARSRLIHNVER